MRLALGQVGSSGHAVLDIVDKSFIRASRVCESMVSAIDDCPEGRCPHGNHCGAGPISGATSAMDQESKPKQVALPSLPTRALGQVTAAC